MRCGNLPGHRMRPWLAPTRWEHGDVALREGHGDVLGAAVDAGQIAVVPGFQGVTKDGRISLAGLNSASVDTLANAMDDSFRNC